MMLTHYYTSNIFPNAEPQMNDIMHHLDGLLQDCSNSIANALELLQSCTKSCICDFKVLSLLYICSCCVYSGILDNFHKGIWSIHSLRVYFALINILWCSAEYYLFDSLCILEDNIEEIYRFGALVADYTILLPF